LNCPASRKLRPAGGRNRLQLRDAKTPSWSVPKTGHWKARASAWITACAGALPPSELVITTAPCPVLGQPTSQF